MHRTFLFIVTIIFSFSCLSTVEDSEIKLKKEFINSERKKLAENGFRVGQMLNGIEDTDVCIDLLLPGGQFKDLVFLQDEWDKLNQADVQQQQILGDYLELALTRLWKIAELFRGGKMPDGDPEELRNLVFKSYTIYHKFEISRPVTGRFHQSCFAMPRSAINTYFCFFDIMEKIEKGELRDPLLEKGRDAMMDIGFQSWTQPKRLDQTDEDVVSVERFRKHVWWVGGNALAYRALFECAAMMSSVEMMDVIAEVSSQSISSVSQTTFEESFWTEGLTSDGAGWGHGMQCLVWGYPIHGTSAALNNLNRFIGTPWAQKLKRDNIDCLFNFLRGSAFLYHKGNSPPALSRYSMYYGDIKPKPIPTLNIVDNLLENWKTSFTSEELAELQQFKEEAEALNLSMSNYPDGFYHGTRYFFNNDNFVKKTDEYYTLISMASRRCDGIESFHQKADGYNIHTCDGMTLFQRSGDEYKLAAGAWNLTAPPGVTARQLDVLYPFTNWRGYTSKHNFAAGATHGGSNGVTGFIFEKLNGSAKENVNDLTGLNEKNPDIYGIKAYKSYFWFEDLMLAMGAGINDGLVGLDRPVWTVVEQTIASADDPALNGTRKVNDGELVWITNNNFSYAVLPEHTSGDTYYSYETRSTFYDSLNADNISIRNLPQTVDIFQMWIDHGHHPRNEDYAYIVNLSPNKAFKIPRIISNDTTLQAACSEDGEIIEAIFYDQNRRLEVNDYWFEVSSKCALMAEIEEGRVIITVCDAQMDRELDELTVKTNMPLSGPGVSRGKEYKTVTIHLPTEPFRGKPASVVLDL